MSTFTLAPTAPSHPRWRAALAAALVAVPLAGHLPQAAAQAGPKPAAARNAHNDPDFYVGLWVTRDGHVRHRLLPGGRYDEARGQRESAYRGRYTLRGDHIDYVDDTGFTADGEFRDGVLYHGGMVLYRQQGR
jgi:hypothetical protein